MGSNLFSLSNYRFCFNFMGMPSYPCMSAINMYIFIFLIKSIYDVSLYFHQMCGSFVKFRDIKNEQKNATVFIKKKLPSHLAQLSWSLKLFITNDTLHKVIIRQKVHN